MAAKDSKRSGYVDQRVTDMAHLVLLHNHRDTVFKAWGETTLDNPVLLVREVSWKGVSSRSKGNSKGKVEITVIPAEQRTGGKMLASVSSVYGQSVIYIGMDYVGGQFLMCGPQRAFGRDAKEVYERGVSDYQRRTLMVKAQNEAIKAAADSPLAWRSGLSMRQLVERRGLASVNGAFRPGPIVIALGELHKHGLSKGRGVRALPILYSELRDALSSWVDPYSLDIAAGYADKLSDIGYVVVAIGELGITPIYVSADDLAESVAAR